MPEGQGWSSGTKVSRVTSQTSMCSVRALSPSVWLEWSVCCHALGSVCCPHGQVGRNILGHVTDVMSIRLDSNMRMTQFPPLQRHPETVCLPRHSFLSCTSHPPHPWVFSHPLNKSSRCQGTRTKLISVPLDCRADNVTLWDITTCRRLSSSPQSGFPSHPSSPPPCPRHPGVWGGWVHWLPFWRRASCPISWATARRLCSGTEEVLKTENVLGFLLC